MIDSYHLLKEVIRPVLNDLKLGGGRAEAQVLGTICKESHCGLWLVQLGNGPARGINQMEPATHDDCWNNFLSDRPELAKRINRWRIRYGNGTGAEELVGNLYYAVAMTRIHYLRVPAPLPFDLTGQAHYWKQYYNTVDGKGTVEEYIEAWKRFAPTAWV